MSQQLKEHKLRLETVVANLSAAHRMRKEVEETEKIIDTLQEEIAKLNGEVSQKEKSEAKLRKASDEVKDAINQITQLTAIKDQLQLECQSIRSTLREELDDAVDELRRVNENFESEVKECQIKKQELERGRLHLQKEKGDLEKSGNKLAEEYGKFKSAMEQFAHLKTSRDSHIISISESYHIDGYTEGPFSDATVEAFMEKTNDLSKKAQESLMTIQTENKKKNTTRRVKKLKQYGGNIMIWLIK